VIYKSKNSPVIVVNPESDDRAYYRITKQITKIGSQPKADIQFPESIIARNAITLESRDGEILIYNRAGYQIFVNDEPIAHNDSATWEDESLLSINDQLQMILLMDPQRKRKAAASAVEEGEESTENHKNEGSVVRKAVLSGLILFALMAMLLMETPQNSNAAGNENASLEKLIKQAHSSLRPNPIKLEIVKQLQMAVREQYRTGVSPKDRLIRQRDKIESLRDPQTDRLPDKWFDESLAYIHQKISKPKL
jgi:hypothetical protein